MSPRSPITLRKTVASVPLPLTVPVQIVTRYFITKKGHVIMTIVSLSCRSVVKFHQDPYTAVAHR